MVGIFLLFLCFELLGARAEQLQAEPSLRFLVLLFVLAGGGAAVSLVIGRVYHQDFTASLVQYSQASLHR